MSGRVCLRGHECVPTQYSSKHTSYLKIIYILQYAHFKYSAINVLLQKRVSSLPQTKILIATAAPPCALCVSSVLFGVGMAQRHAGSNLVSHQLF